MHVTFLGGAERVGGTCQLVEVERHYFLVDCGIAMGNAEYSVPHLDAVAQIGLDAIILTHAHADHIGALPVLFRTIGQVPVIASSATVAMVPTMLYDALHLVREESRAQRTESLFRAADVASVVSALRPVDFEQPCHFIGGRLSVVLFPAGHILGAASVFFWTAASSLYVTGDLSVANQLTVPGAAIPDTRVSMLVLESTYGNRLHAKKEEERERLVEQVEEVLRHGGSVLFPVFAIGRAQEVLLLLLSAIESGQLPQVQIIVDGLVRRICGVYAWFPELVTRSMKSRIFRQGSPFGTHDGLVTFIKGSVDRASAARLLQAIYVSSSGMLTGGPSVQYAREKIAPDHKSLIAFSGFQDSESPGRRILELAGSSGGKSLALDGIETEIRCRVETYQLSAHADAAQLARIGVSFARKGAQVALVHGEQTARRKLARLIRKTIGKKIVLLPKDGQTLEVPEQQSNMPNCRRPAITMEPEMPPLALSKKSVSGLAALVKKQPDPLRFWSVQELLCLIGVYRPLHDRSELRRAEDLFAAAGLERHATATSLFRLPALRAPKGARWSTQQDFEQMIEDLFVEADRPRLSFYHSDHRVKLHFRFPQAALPHFKLEIDSLLRQSDWTVEVDTDTLVEDLVLIAVEFLSAHAPVLREDVLVDQGEQLVIVGVLERPCEQKERMVCRAFEMRTGFGLKITFPWTVELLRKKNRTAASAVPNSKKGVADHVERIFPRSVYIGYGYDDATGVVTFFFPYPKRDMVQYAEQIKLLSQQTKCEVSVDLVTPSNRLREAVHNLVPEDWLVEGKPPVVRRDQNRVHVRVNGYRVKPEQSRRVREAYKELTGLDLIFM